MRRTTILLSFFAFSCALLTALPTANADLVGWWTFDGDAQDSSGNANHGTLVGNPTFPADFPAALGGGTSILFDGVDDYVDVAQNVDLPISQHTAFTVSMWVKGAPQGDRRVFSEGSSTNNTPLYNLGTDNLGETGAFDLFVRADAGTVASHLKSTNPAFDSTWHHVAFVDNNGSGQLYIDGILDPGNFNYARSPLTVNTTTFGGILRATPCCWYNGNIDDAAIWTSALDASAISALAQGSAPPTIMEPVPPPPPQPGDVFMIDIDSTFGGGPLSTEPGWTSLDATAGNGSGVTVGAVNFSVGSVDGSRIRVDGGNNPNPNALTGDFIFDDGDGQAVILFFGGAGSLPAGQWRVDAYIFDSSADVGPQIVGLRANAAETIISDAVMPDANNAAISFEFTSDGTSAYDVFVRENNTLSQSRLNAVKLTYVPEPSSGVLVMLGAAGGFLLWRRRTAG